MKSGYVEINNYNRLGQMGISHVALEHIASIATDEVEGASVKKRSKNLFNLDRPVYATIRKDGMVDIHIDVVMKMGADVKKVCLQIQNSVSDAITMMCETIPFAVKVKVVNVK
jgi:uncharacterized alkaline shock family protein YloU